MPKKLRRPLRSRAGNSAGRPAAASTLEERQGGEGPAGRLRAGLGEGLIAPYLTEAQAVLAEGIVADADLADAGLIFGTGFAPFRGGPLNYLAGQKKK